MPTLKNRLPKVCKHHRGQAFVKLNGYTYWLGRYGTPAATEAYNQLMAEYLANDRQMPEPADASSDEPVTVTEVCLAFKRHTDQRYESGKASTIRSAIRIVRRLCGTEPAAAFGPNKLRQAREQMKAKGWSRSYINEQVRWVRSMFKWAASHEMVPATIYQQLATVEPLRRGEARETDPVKPVARSDIRRVRRHLSRPVRGLINLQMLTGARAKELVGLRPVDLEMSGSVWTYRPQTHKTAYRDKERVIYFGPRAQKVLSVFLGPQRPVDQPVFSPRQANAERKRIAGVKGRRDSQKASPTKSGRRIGDAYTTASYRRAIHRACKVVKVDQWGPHRLRHNAATFLRRQFGVDVASTILGHSSLAVTMTYAEANHKRAVEVMGKVG